jgi:ABC-type uncharacterized transport system ATPase subunit
VISYKPLAVDIEVDLTRQDLQTEVSNIFSAFPISDINISNIAIEEVIKEIYNA